MSNHEQPTTSHPKSDSGIRSEKLQTPQISMKWSRERKKVRGSKSRLDFWKAQEEDHKGGQESRIMIICNMSPRNRYADRSPRHNPSVFTRLRRERSRSPRHEYKDKARREGTVFKRLGSRGRSISMHSDNRQESSRYTESRYESEDSEGGHWKSKSRRKKSSVEDDNLSQPWVCAETDPFTSRIRISTSQKREYQVM
ncbi:hypothetical protein Tco_1090507 [Tanacetum coccineum]|uniref:Uncharacterized protein n=1 Tax=Tanacetum coccineum TaxID=301880 RepID=A0ABQ5I4G3_9ASTR